MIESDWHNLCWIAFSTVEIAIEMTQVLVAIKPFSEAKTRLAGVLSPTERRDLAEAMAHDTVALLVAHPEVSEVTVVSADERAKQLALDCGAGFSDERTLTVQGLNAVLEAILDTLAVESDLPLLIVHSDLPLLCAEDISVAIAHQRQSGGLVIGCDSRGTGTNALAFNAASRVPLQFGFDSCARHRQQAAAAGVAERVLLRPGMGLDIDGPEDYQTMLELFSRGDLGHCVERLLSEQSYEYYGSAGNWQSHELCSGSVY